MRLGIPSSWPRLQFEKSSLWLVLLTFLRRKPHVYGGQSVLQDAVARILKTKSRVSRHKRPFKTTQNVQLQNKTIRKLLFSICELGPYTKDEWPQACTTSSMRRLVGSPCITYATVSNTLGACSMVELGPAWRLLAHRTTKTRNK